MESYEEIERVAKIARIKLSEEEKEKFAKQIPSILSLFSKVSEADPKEEASLHPIPISGNESLREDEPKKFEWNPLSNAKEKEGRYIKGPRIV
ncbi:MAG: Asp-tRNA(Asn)/Glu-tRNA(Gln) amidotransferase subunit GatC [Candidatus Micrarchaeaceae archaeon]